MNPSKHISQKLVVRAAHLAAERRKLVLGSKHAQRLFPGGKIVPLKRTKEEAIAMVLALGNQVEECVEWPRLSKKGYGIITFEGKEHYAHRLSFEVANGSIQDNLEVCHRCDNPACINPAHLFQATHKQNMMDMANKGRWGNKISPGSSNGFARWSESDVLRMREMRNSGMTFRAIGAVFGCGDTSVYYATRKGWKHLKTNAEPAPQPSEENFDLNV